MRDIYTPLKRGVAFLLILALAGIGYFSKDASCIETVNPKKPSACQPMPYNDYHEGDVIAHTSRSRQSKMIKRMTRSPYTHMGIVVSKGGNKYVLEAVGPVKYTPLRTWINRGVERKHTVKRLQEPYLPKIPAIISAAKRFLGKPYDFKFLPSDDAIYCSELVAKAMAEGGDINVGNWKYFPQIIGPGAVKLADGKLRKEIERRWGKNLPITEKAITPKSIMGSSKLETVCSDF